MTIIQIKSMENGQHPIQSQSGRASCWIDGFVEVPAHLEASVWSSMGWCNLDIQDGVLVGITPTERPEPEPEPEPTTSPTELEKLRADIDFIAAMGGIEL